MTSILELIAVLEWIALGVFVLFRFRKLDKKLNGVLDDIKRQEEESEKNVCYQECNLSCDSCANQKEDGCMFRSVCVAAVFQGKQVSKPSFFVPKEAGNE